MIDVVFECGSITVYSCKDLSNVVLEFENGERQRFEGLQGQVGTFSGSAGGRIVGVWVKAGSNGSGDGPGYGERFDVPMTSARAAKAAWAAQARAAQARAARAETAPATTMTRMSHAVRSWSRWSRWR